MVARKFSVQKGSQRQKSLNKSAMASCGEDLAGILNTRYGKTLKTQISRPDKNTPAEKLAKVLGKVFELAPWSTRLRWLAIVQSGGFKRSAILQILALPLLLWRV
jgi:hypothetical protein